MASKPDAIPSSSSFQTIKHKDTPHHIVVIGAGFGGVQLVHSLQDSGARITLIDKQNHHLFQPLLYQVATSILTASDIAWPLRSVFRERKDVTTILACVCNINPDKRLVELEDGSHLTYDTLIVATGARHAYFGHDEWEDAAPGLKTLEDATMIRNRLLLAFEHAERESDPAAREALMTFAVIGAGPTGVELVGTVAELAKRTLRQDFRHIDTRKARILLIEAGSRILTMFPEDLSAYAAGALKERGVEIRLGKPVSNCTSDGLNIGDEFIPCRTTIWAAGVMASPAAEWLGVKGDRARRVPVQPDLTLEGHPEIFVIGDTATVAAPDGKPVPGVAPAAKQQGKYVASVIKARLAVKAAPDSFRYRHQGDLATIGQGAAVVHMGRLRLRGKLAWWLWGIAHIFFLIGIRSRVAVAGVWFWTFVTGRYSSRLIIQGFRGKWRSGRG